MKNKYFSDLLMAAASVIEAKKGKCKPSGCIEQIENKWRIRSNKTGKLWPQKYDTKEAAEAALKAYQVHKSV